MLHQNAAAHSSNNNKTERKKRRGAGGLFVSWGAKKGLMMLGSAAAASAATLAAHYYLLSSSFPNKTHANYEELSSRLENMKVEKEATERNDIDLHNHYERALEGMERNLEATQRAYAALQLQLTQAKSTKSAAAAVDLTQELDERDELRAELAQLKTKVATLDAENRAMTKENAQMLAEMEEKAGEWPEQWEDAPDVFDKSEKELELAKANLVEKQRQNEDLQITLDQANALIADERAEKMELQAGFDSQAKEIKRMEGILETRTGDFNEKIRNLRQIEDKRDEYKQQMLGLVYRRSQKYQRHHRELQKTEKPQQS